MLGIDVLDLSLQAICEGSSSLMYDPDSCAQEALEALELLPLRLLEALGLGGL